MNSLILILAGIACLTLSSFMIYQIKPREGKPVSVWTKTESRATAAALSVFVLMITGGAMLVKGLIS